MMHSIRYGYVVRAQVLLQAVQSRERKEKLQERAKKNGNGASSNGSPATQSDESKSKSAVRK